MASPKSAPKSVCPKIGEIIQGKYKILKTLGEGGFGAVFEVVDENTKAHYAMKFELEKQPEGEPGLDLEGAVLKRLAGYDHILQYIDEGEWSTRKITYLIMELAGPSLANLRHRLKDHHFSNNTSTRIAIQSLTAIETVHLAGLLHRDIKPGNFAMGYSEKNKRTVYILDFGLVRKHVLKNGRIRPQRSSAAFRGSIQYASINAHKNIDLGRMDDVWCWLYMMIQLRVGKLPWRHLSGKNKVGAMKIETPKNVLLLRMEEAYHTIYDSLEALKYADQPPYIMYRECLTKIMEKRNFTFTDPFDWEDEQEAPTIKTEKDNTKQTDKAQSKLSQQKQSGDSKAVKTVDHNQMTKNDKTKISNVKDVKHSKEQAKSDQILNGENVNFKSVISMDKSENNSGVIVETSNYDWVDEFALTTNIPSKTAVVQEPSTQQTNAKIIRETKVVSKINEESKPKNDKKKGSEVKPNVVQKTGREAQSKTSQRSNRVSKTKDI